MKSIKLFQPLTARPARIFKALTDPGDLAAWHADAVRGRAQVGRGIELEWPTLGVALSLEVQRLVPERSVLFSGALGTLELSVTNGGVELCHTAPFDDEALAGTESSWRITLALLATYLSRHVDERRQVHWATTQAVADVELCHAYFSDARLLSTWFGGADTSIGDSESLVSLRLGNQLRIRGPVLAHTRGRDLAFRWVEADDSVLSMRTLPLPDSPRSRLILLGWSRWSKVPNAGEIASELNAAAARLGSRLNAMGRA